MIREAAREFTMARVVPIASKPDKAKGQIPRELIDEIAGMGYFGILIPAEHGGLGLGCLRVLPGGRAALAWLDECREFDRAW
jgi:alkylation response protein AidB-like acyl-CoA dehydrogenase